MKVAHDKLAAECTHAASIAQADNKAEKAKNVAYLARIERQKEMLDRIAAPSWTRSPAVLLGVGFVVGVGVSIGIFRASR